MNNKRPGAPAGVSLPPSNATLEKPLPDNATPDELKDAAINITVADLEERVASTRDSWETESLFEDVLDELANGADGK
jgi:NAD-dependent histone deacetylase SIR2